MKNCIFIHLYYTEIWNEFKPYILPILKEEETDLFISYVTFDENIEDCLKYVKGSFLVENRGLDIGPFIYFLDKIGFETYSIVTKIHTKKSIYHGREESFGDEWRKNLYMPLISDLDSYKNNVGILQDKPGILGAKKYYFCPEDDLNNFMTSSLKEDLEKIENFLQKKFRRSPFIAGSIFMTNFSYLKDLFQDTDLLQLYSRFEIGYQKGDTIAHAFERIFGYGIEKFNYNFNLV